MRFESGGGEGVGHRCAAQRQGQGHAGQRRAQLVLPTQLRRARQSAQRGIEMLEAFQQLAATLQEQVRQSR